MCTNVRMSTPTLTERQQKTLSFLQEYLQAQGLPPTLREIAEALGFSSHSSAQACVGVAGPQGRARTLAAAPRFAVTARPRLPPAPSRRQRTAPRRPRGRRQSDPRHRKHRRRVRHRRQPVPPATGLLAARGRFEHARRRHPRRRPAAIHRTETADDGRIVVARLDDEVTVKTPRTQARTDSPAPVNPDFEPIEIDPRSRRVRHRRTLCRHDPQNLIDELPSLTPPSHQALPRPISALGEVLRDRASGAGCRAGFLDPSPGWQSSLDALLPGGGWPMGALTEILFENDGLGELSW